MINSKNRQLLITMILACICAPALSVESTEAKTELKFEISNKELPWLVDKKGGGEQPGRGPLKPTHVAELFIAHAQNFPDFSSPAVMKKTLDTSAGKALSQEQANLISTNNICRLGSFGDTVGNHYHFRLYAVSEDEAKKMAEAFIEFLTNEANAKIQPAISHQQELQKKIAEAKKKIPQTETEAKSAKAKLDELKKTAHFLSSDEAKKTILELNKMLNTLDIEIVGIRARLATIEQYQAKGKDKGFATSESVDKLEQMEIEQTIELKAALAKKEAATAIRKQAEEFYNLRMASKKVDYLKQDVMRYERDIHQFKERLDEPEMMPPALLQNKVTIYPVHVDERSEP